MASKGAGRTAGGRRPPHRRCRQAVAGLPGRRLDPSPPRCLAPGQPPCISSLHGAGPVLRGAAGRHPVGDRRPVTSGIPERWPAIFDLNAGLSATGRAHPGRSRPDLPGVEARTPRCAAGGGAQPPSRAPPVDQTDALTRAATPSSGGTGVDTSGTAGRASGAAHAHRLRRGEPASPDRRRSGPHRGRRHVGGRSLNQWTECADRGNEWADRGNEPADRGNEPSNWGNEYRSRGLSSTTAIHHRPVIRSHRMCIKFPRRVSRAKTVPGSRRLRRPRSEFGGRHHRPWPARPPRAG